MQDSARNITYGAMMLALYAVLLALTMYVPVGGIVTLFFLPLPIILYRLKHDRKSSLLMAAVGFALSIVVGGFQALPFAIIFIVLGLMIGEMIRLGKSKFYTFMATGLTLLILGMLAYVAAVFLFEFNVVDRVLALLAEMQKTLLEFGPQTDALSANYKEWVLSVFAFYRSAIPMAFIGTIFFFSYTIIILNYAIMKRTGIDVPKFPPIRDLRLPVIVVFIYGLLLIYSLLGTIDESSSIYILYINATILLRFLFFLQGISLIQYFMHKMKTPGIVTVLVTVFGFLLGPITILLGIFDVAANVRAWIDKDQTR